jgi:hypothetical protein
MQEEIMSSSEPIQQEHTRPLTIRGWSFFDKVRFRWGGGGDVLLGISLIVIGGNAGGIIFGLLFIILGIATWIFTNFGRGRGPSQPSKDKGDWYLAWNSMTPTGRGIASTGSVIGNLFLFILFFYIVIIRLVWKYIIEPGKS